MSTHQKLNARQTEITQLKRLWRDDLPEADRDYWREQFESSRTPKELRHEIEEKYNLTLRHDTQLKRFRHWVTEQDDREAEHQRAADDLAELEQQGLTLDQLRDELLRRMQVRALARGDFNLGLKAIAAGVKVETLQLAQERFHAAYRTKVEAGLRALSRYIQGNPAADAAFEAFCAIVEPDKAASKKPVETPQSNRPAAPKCNEGGPVASKRSEDGSAGHRPGSMDATTTHDQTQSNPIKPTEDPVGRVPSRDVGAPVSDPARPTCSANSIGAPSIARPEHASPRPTCSPSPISPIRPIAQNPSESNPIKPASSPAGRVPSHGDNPTPATQPPETTRDDQNSIRHSNGKPSFGFVIPEKATSPEPAIPTIDPKIEYENCLWRMQNNFEPYDEAELQKLYALIPPEQK